LVDPFRRRIKSLRLSVTQRCDLACAHCHREGQKPANDEMTPAEIERLVRVAAGLGISKVKITGGEPLLREDIVDIVQRISPLLKEASLTTNGTRLSALAIPLKKAGLSRVNVSMHTLDPERYRRLCGPGDLDHVTAGIKSAVSAGLNPVKVNMVVFKNENEKEIPNLMEFCSKMGAVLQLIEYEGDRVDACNEEFVAKHLPLAAIESGLAREAIATSVNELHRRRRFLVPANGTRVEVEVVRPMHNTEFCSNCSRLRLTSDGKLKPCLLESAGEVDVLAAIRNGASDGQISELLKQVVRNRRPYWS
jgi:cyclic pyranopterin phosphate synthase